MSPETTDERPQGRFLPWLPPSLITGAQRVLTTLAVVCLTLPLVSLKSCNGPTRAFTGFEYFLSRSMNQLGFAFMVVVVLAMMIAPWRPRPRERPGRAMVELAHASLLAVGVGVVCLLVGAVPVADLFATSRPLYGYPILLGCWVMLYGVLVLSGLPRLVGLFAARPKWWLLVAIAAVPVVPPAKLIFIQEFHLEVFAICAVISAIVGTPLGLALVSSGEVAKRGGTSGRAILGLSLGAWAAWMTLWSFAFS